MNNKKTARAKTKSDRSNKSKKSSAASRATMARSTTSKRIKNIAIITGTRADFGLLKSTMTAIKDHPDLRLQVIVTGMHLLEPFGCTVDEIVAERWPVIAKIPMQTGRDDRLDNALGLARGIDGIAQTLWHAKTNAVVVLGDRIEALAGALATVTTGKILAHIHGGDLAPGDFDDAYRNAITKLAHIHFPATELSAKRILKLGEFKKHVHVVGAPGLDRILELKKQSKTTKPNPGEEITRAEAVIIQHPTGRPEQAERKTMTAILKAVAAKNLNTLVIYPNADAGHSGVLSAIHAAESAGQVRTVPSMPRDEYLRTLINAKVLVGNSSSGIIEAAAAGTPAVNVGTRQKGRQTDSSAVINCTEYAPAITTALEKALKKRPVQKSTSTARTAYGRGGAGQKIAKIIAATRFTDDLIHKNFV